MTMPNQALTLLAAAQQEPFLVFLAGILAGMLLLATFLYSGERNG